jgi:sialate O-acetylesterase
MINSWRSAWNKQLPFYYVQIAPYKYGDKNVAALIREQQAKVMSLSNVGMVVVTDLVDNINDIHPKDKHDVGYRLANWALAETYHQSGTVYKNPVYKNMEVQQEKAIIHFDNASNGLMSKEKNITEIYIAGDDKVFYPAEARIQNDQLIVWSKQVKQPVAVRFGFSNTAIPDLFSKEGLPVCPFRTDNWEVDTSKEQ